MFYINGMLSGSLVILKSESDQTDIYCRNYQRGIEKDTEESKI